MVLPSLNHGILGYQKYHIAGKGMIHTVRGKSVRVQAGHPRFVFFVVVT